MEYVHMNYNEHKLNIGDADFVFFSTQNMICQTLGVSSPIHAHDFFELFYVLKGDVKIHTESSEYAFSQGDCALIEEGFDHTSEICPDSQRIAISFFVKKSKKNIEPRYFEVFKNKNGKGIYGFKNFIGADAFKRLAGYYYSDFTDKFELMISCLHEIIALVKANITDESSIPNSQKIFDDTSFRKYLINEYFNSNFEGKSLSKLADMLHLSCQQTQRIIKQTYGQTYRERMIFAKMRYAKSLLSTTNLSISKIASKVGYTCVHSFFDTFKKEFGITPNEYRKSHKKG